jgi:osmoprotectant transport system ATP-binding protein
MPAMSEPPAIEFAHVEYRTGEGRVLLSDLNLAVARGEILMLLGPSGSGKTTTLKLINALLTTSRGTVSVEGRAVADWDLIELRRHIGYAIQEVGLFPHYTVRKNVALVPRLESWHAARTEQRVSDVLQMVGLPLAEFGERYPDQLSGGQRQRVGLARALAADPPILLMDEPFGAVDPLTRAELQREFKQLQQRLRKTVAFVTHDVGEALLLADRIALMDAGRLHGVYTPQEFAGARDATVIRYLDALRATQQMLAT